MFLVVSVVIALSSIAMAARAPAPVLKDKGVGEKQTQKFRVKKDWALSWTYDCSPAKQGIFMIWVNEEDGTTAYEQMSVEKVGGIESGVDHFHRGGTYFLDIDTSCSWQVSVFQS